MLIRIMGLKERKDNIKKMLSSLPKNTEVIWDTDHNSCHTLQRVVDSNNSMLIMEDDIELCKNFYNKAMEAIKKTPDSVVMFYATKRGEEKCMKDITEANNLPYVYTQAYYLPAGLGKELSKFLETDIHAKAHRYSIGINRFLQDKGIKKYLVLPALVQHIGFESIGEPGKKGIMHQSKTYVYDDGTGEVEENLPHKKTTMKINFKPQKESYTDYLKKLIGAKKKKASSKKSKKEEIIPEVLSLDELNK